MKTELTGFEEPFDFYVVAFIDRKTREIRSYYKSTWKRANTPMEAMHFHTQTWAKKRADENNNDMYETKVVRYHAEFKAIVARRDNEKED